jgi:hypothetical protein
MRFGYDIGDRPANPLLMKILRPYIRYEPCVSGKAYSKLIGDYHNESACTDHPILAFRRLKIGIDRHDVIYRDWNSLAAAVVCWKILVE